MKLRSILIMGLLGISFSKLSAQSNGINWKSFANWKAVLEEAEKSNKAIFLDLYATWCVPCKLMDKDVYAVDTVGAFINANFLPVKVQMDSLSWDDAKIKSWYASISELKSAYSVKAFPTLLFLSPEGEIYKKSEGAKDAAGLLQEARSALDPKNQFSIKLKSYKAGRREPEFVRDLARQSGRLGDLLVARKIANEYIQGLSEQEIFTQENVWFIYDFTKRSTDPGFAVLKDKQKEIEQIDKKLARKYTESKVNMIIRFEAIEPYRKDNNGKANWTIINENLKPFGAAGQKTLEWLKPDIFFNDEFQFFLDKNPDWKMIQKEVSRHKFDRKAMLRLYENILYHANGQYLKGKSPDNKVLVSVASFYFSQPDVVLTGGLDHLANTFSWMAFGKFKDEAGLKAALKWSERAMADEPNGSGNIDTYANLLYKLGRKDEALKWQEKALILNPGDEEIKENYSKMKAGSRTWKD